MENEYETALGVPLSVVAQYVRRKDEAHALLYPRRLGTRLDLALRLWQSQMSVAGTYQQQWKVLQDIPPSHVLAGVSPALVLLQEAASRSARSVKTMQSVLSATFEALEAAVDPLVERASLNQTMAQELAIEQCFSAARDKWMLCSIEQELTQRIQSIIQGNIPAEWTSWDDIVIAVKERAKREICSQPSEQKIDERESAVAMGTEDIITPESGFQAEVDSSKRMDTNETQERKDKSFQRSKRDREGSMAMQPHLKR